MLEVMTKNPARCVIEAFGGVRKTARILGVDLGAVSRWQKRGLVPNSLQKKILDIAEIEKLELTADDIIRGRKVD